MSAQQCDRKGRARDQKQPETPKVDAKLAVGEIVHGLEQKAQRQ
jgi:hypothetical protein